MIPKVAHFYWGEPVLPFLRYATLKSFCKFNPDWEVRLYVPKRYSEEASPKTWATHEQKYEFIGEDYWGRVKDLRVKTEVMDFRYLAHFLGGMAEVHKSDYLRWWLLSTVGGLWSDMDIIYFKPVYLDLADYDTYVCTNLTYGHSIGFLLGSSNNLFYQYIRHEAEQRFDPANYQSIGSILMNSESHLLPSFDPYFSNLPMDVVYSYDALTFPEIYVSPAPRPVRFTADTIGLHWYAGHPMAAEYVNEITEKNYDRYDNVLGLALQLAEA
jgi:hypothetical protein